MIQVIESVSPSPIRFLPDESSKLEPGLIVQIVELDGTPKCTLSDGTRPFGIIGETGGPYGLVSVWFDSMIVRTDKFEKRGESYEPGSSLYVSKRGKLTSRKPFETSQLIGHVIFGPSEERNYLEINWI